MIQTSTLAPLMLTVDPSPRRRELLDGMAATMTRPRMAALIKIFRPLAGRRDIVFGPEAGGDDTAAAFRYMLCRSSIPSSEVTRRVFTALYGSADNVRAAFAALPGAYAAVIGRVLDCVYVSGAYIKACVSGHLEKYPVPVWPEGTEESFVNADAVSHVLQRVAAGTRDDSFTIDTRMMGLLSDDLGHGIYRAEPVTALGTLPGGLRTYSTGERALSLMQTMRPITRSGEIDYDRCGVVRPGSLRTAAAMFSVPELFTDSAAKTMHVAALRAMLSLTRAIYGDTGLPVDAASLRSRLSGGAELDPCMMVSIACPWVERLRPFQFYGITGSDMLGRMTAAVAAAADGRSDRWLDAGRLVAAAFRSGDNSGRMLIASGAFDAAVYDEANAPRVSPDVQLTRGNVLTAYTLPLLRGMLMVMSWLGLLEVAADPARLTAARPLDALRYVRLTALGRYVLGLEAEYTPGADLAGEAAVALDPDHLLVTVNNPGAGDIVADMCGREVAPGVYAVDSAGYMRGVDTAADLDAKTVALLAMCRLDALPPLWAGFVDGLRRRLGSVRAAATDDWLMYDIDPECTGLVAAVRDDPAVRAMVRLVEGNSLLVRRADFTSLDALLRSAGYVLPAIKNHTI